MNAVSALRAGLDPALLAARQAEALPQSRTGSPQPQQAVPGAGVSQGAALLASLYTRLDEARAVAMAERTASGGDPTQGDPERLRKLFPPYPAEYQSRASYLESLAGLGKQNAALTLPVERGDELPGEAERRMQEIGRTVANALSGRPDLGMSQNPARAAPLLTQAIDEGHA